MDRNQRTAAIGPVLGARLRPTQALRQIEVNQHSGVDHHDRIGAVRVRHLEAALLAKHRYSTVGQLARNGVFVDLIRLRRADDDVDLHFVATFADGAKQAEARMADRVADRALGGARIVAAVNVDPHAHFGHASLERHIVPTFAPPQRRDEQSQREPRRRP